MFRILVADDERITRRGIITMLQRGLKEEVEYIEAKNGKEALEISKKQLIHLIITDICMPLCSGLEFVEELKKTDPEMTVIIISGYENFEYAKQAVRLGVRDYVMKPVNKDEFLNLAESCIAEISKKQMEAEQRYKQKQKNEKIMSTVKQDSFLGLLNGEKTEQCLDRLAELDVVFDRSFIQCAVLEYESNESQDFVVDFVVKNITDECLEQCTGIEFVTFPFEKGSLAAIFSMEEMADRDRIRKVLENVVFLVEKHVRIKAAAGIGEIVFRPHEISKSFRESRLAADFKIYENSHKIFSYGELPKGEKVWDTLDVPVMISQPDGEKQILAYFDAMIKAEHTLANLEQIRKSYEEAVCCYEKKMKAYRENGEKAFRCSSFSGLWGIFHIRREIRKMMQSLAWFSLEGMVGENSSLVREIMEYTSEHVTEDIDLNYIADYFGKTPGYIGALFRKGNHVGFNEFVTRERIKLARNLLKDHRITIQQVGERCGYHNVKYFSVVFKKITGCTPKAYQKSLEND